MRHHRLIGTVLVLVLVLVVAGDPTAPLGGFGTIADAGGPSPDHPEVAAT